VTSISIAERRPPLGAPPGGRGRRLIPEGTGGRGDSIRGGGYVLTTGSSGEGEFGSPFWVSRRRASRVPATRCFERRRRAARPRASSLRRGLRPRPVAALTKGVGLDEVRFSRAPTIMVRRCTPRRGKTPVDRAEGEHEAFRAARTRRVGARLRRGTWWIA
jgi:hypothetical protein